jgi:N-acetylmuramoyl-L-alanine amidase
MGFIHVVDRGECLSSIAQLHGFLDWRTLYQDPHNDALRALRPNPNLLVRGDKVYIPDKEPRVEEAATGARTVFQATAAPTRLRIAYEGSLPNDYELRVGGRSFTGTVAPGGLIDHPIPPEATEAELVLRPQGAPELEDRWSLLLGELEPIETIGGVQARLDNLGFACPVSGVLDAETEAALAAYQRFRGLSRADGALDDATRADLRAFHDG